MLILGNRQDPIHPWKYRGDAREAHPRPPRFCEITPKSVSLEKHADDVKSAMTRS